MYLVHVSKNLEKHISLVSRNCRKSLHIKCEQHEHCEWEIYGVKKSAFLHTCAILSQNIGEKEEPTSRSLSFFLLNFNFVFSFVFRRTMHNVYNDTYLYTLTCGIVMLSFPFFILIGCCLLISIVVLLWSLMYPGSFRTCQMHQLLRLFADIRSAHTMPFILLCISVHYLISMQFIVKWIGIFKSLILHIHTLNAMQCDRICCFSHLNFI